MVANENEPTDMVFPSAEDLDAVVKHYNAIEGGQQTLARLADNLTKM